jgi:hypothetical protein
MKKKAFLALSATIFMHSFVSAAPAWWNTLTQKLRQSPGAIKRTWVCAIKPAQYNCTQAEHKRGVAWLAGGGTALIGVLVGAGVAVTQSELNKQQEMAQQKVLRESVEAEQAASDPTFGRLMVAIITDLVPLAQEAINEGANVNQRTVQDILPLEQAMLNRNKEMVSLLLLNGADARLVRRNLETTPEIQKLIEHHRKIMSSIAQFKAPPSQS